MNSDRDGLLQGLVLKIMRRKLADYRAGLDPMPQLGERAHKMTHIHRYAPPTPIQDPLPNILWHTFAVGVRKPADPGRL